MNRLWASRPVSGSEENGSGTGAMARLIRALDAATKVSSGELPTKQKVPTMASGMHRPRSRVAKGRRGAANGRGVFAIPGWRPLG
jgi:hypothetical protein